jgi:cold shock CspA family protein
LKQRGFLASFLLITIRKIQLNRADYVSERKIKSFSTPRGFGFIEVEGDIDDVFFHIKDLPQNNIEPKIGEVLQFMIVEDQGKFKAGNIQRLGLSSESKATTSSNKKNTYPSLTTLP